VIGEPGFVIEAGHPVAIERLMVLFVELAVAAGHQSLPGHAIWGISKDLGGVDTMAVLAREQVSQGIQRRMWLEGQLVQVAVLEPLPRPLGKSSFLKAHVQAVVAVVHPTESTLHELLRDQNTQSVSADRALDRTAPGCFLRFYLYQLGHIGKLLLRDTEMAGQGSPELMIGRGDVRAWTGADLLQLLLQGLLFRPALLLGRAGIEGGLVQLLMSLDIFLVFALRVRLVCQQRFERQGAVEAQPLGKLAVVLCVTRSVVHDSLVRIDERPQLLDIGAAGAQVNIAEALRLV